MEVALLMLAYFAGCVSAVLGSRPDRGAEEEDKYLGPVEILNKYGYLAETHSVTSSDGYILTIHRIPYGSQCDSEKRKGPVLVQHGLFSSSVDWFIIGTARGLAYILADSCYDVWMPNSRGNTYSKAHVRLSTESSAYWDFTWHEMGKYDQPAFIDYILNRTGWKNLIYIGHSQGTTQFFIFNSLHPDYTAKVRAAFMLAPIAFMGHCQSAVLKTSSRFQRVLGWAASMVGLNQFLPHNDIVSAVGSAFCAPTQPFTPQICESAIFIGTGFDWNEMNETLFPILLGHIPAGASTKQLLHYAQSMNSGLFRQFDHGFIGNLRTYGQLQPPAYDLSKVMIPTTLFYSYNDWLAAIEDVKILMSKLGNLREAYLIPYDKFNHMDYLFAKDVVPFLYDPLLERMDQS